jgi:hypothetical protein
MFGSEMFDKFLGKICKKNLEQKLLNKKRPLWVSVSELMGDKGMV